MTITMEGGKGTPVETNEFVFEKNCLFWFFGSHAHLCA